MQHVLTHLGITHSYLFMNTFVYPIFGQYDAGLRPARPGPALAESSSTATLCSTR